VESRIISPRRRFSATSEPRVEASSESGKRVGYWPLNLTLFTATFCQSKMNRTVSATRHAQAPDRSHSQPFPHRSDPNGDGYSHKPAAKGGSFLLESPQPSDVFTPADFGATIRGLIGQTAEEFVLKEVFPLIKDLENKKAGLMASLVKKGGEVG